MLEYNVASKLKLTYRIGGEQMKGYLSAKEVARKWNISVRWVNQYIQDGRVPGVERFGKSWAIPEDAVKPEKQKPGVKRAAQAAE